MEPTTRTVHIPPPLVFESLEPVRVPVTLGKEDFVLTEASAGAAAAYQNCINSGATLDDNGTIKVGNMADGIPLLVSRCLFKVKKNPDGTTAIDPATRTAVLEEVTLEWVNGLLNQIVKYLHGVVVRISPGLTSASPEIFDPKGPPTGTPGSSS